MVLQSRGKSIPTLASEAGVSSAYFARVFRLSFLAPDIMLAILRDRHPAGVTAKRLANESVLLANWQTLRVLLELT
jgi:AraC-like DNA-binding protein